MKLAEVKQNFYDALAAVSTMEQLEQVRVEYTGKKGYVTEL